MPKLQFLRNLTAGDHGPLDRLRMVAGNVARRNFRKKVVCCGHYGDPGC